MRKFHPENCHARRVYSTNVANVFKLKNEFRLDSNLLNLNNFDIEAFYMTKTLKDILCRIAFDVGFFELS